MKITEFNIFLDSEKLELLSKSIIIIKFCCKHDV